jgi:DNA polymerase I-like protein with 3'-5' exonuclease and polymerase domains
LLEEFLRGGDVYRRLASEVFEVAYAQIDKNSPERNAAKTMFLAIAYGMGPVSLAAKLSEVLGRPVSEAEAERLLDRFFQRFRKVAAWRGGSVNYCGGRTSRCLIKTATRKWTGGEGHTTNK